MLGTLLIAIPGYGMAFLCLGGLAVAVGRITKPSDDAPVKEAIAVFFFAAAAMAFAAITRWLVGSVL